MIKTQVIMVHKWLFLIHNCQTWEFSVRKKFKKELTKSMESSKIKIEKIED